MTKCDSGLTLNPLMHTFLFVMLVLSVGFLFFGNTVAVQNIVLYQQSKVLYGTASVNLWGVIGLSVCILHFFGFLIRGKHGIKLMKLAIFGGCYLWVYALFIYLSSGFIFQVLFVCVPHLWFWTWYAWQWRRRKNNEFVAFV